MIHIITPETNYFCYYFIISFLHLAFGLIFYVLIKDTICVCIYWLVFIALRLKVTSSFFFFYLVSHCNPVFSILYLKCPSPPLQAQRHLAILQ